MSSPTPRRYGGPSGHPTGIGSLSVHKIPGHSNIQSKKGVAEVPDVIWSHDKLSIAFPNLQSLNVSVLRNVPPGLMDTTSPLLRPTLRKLWLSAEISRTGFPFHSALRRIAQDQTLSLDEMSLSCIWGINHLLDAGSAAVRSQRNLRRLRLYSAEDIAALSGAARYLPCLTELDVGNLGSVFQPLNMGILDWSADPRVISRLSSPYAHPALLLAFTSS